MTQMELERELLETERKLWSNDAAFYESNLVEEAVLVFAETGVITRAAALAAIRQENLDGRRWAEVRFEDVRVVQPSENTCFLSYKAAARWEREVSKIFVLATSVYVRRGGMWKLALHQQTPIHDNAGEQAAIRSLIENWASAVRARDVDGILANHSSEMLLFDVPAPAASKGIEAYRKSWDPFFSWSVDPVVFDLSAMEVTPGSDVAYATALLRCAGMEQSGEKSEPEVRLTIGLRKIGGEWRVMHEHHSVPAS